ncbi:hypothetical protein D0Z00_002096 [Geotrichum galactomycetum]|uniref:Uncharacterized protein n=1 Tax=Geotrichum galactomycetum TaxID=27317 RepID=A0ACB6V568_9ASCO|nr:hypothetical protein D0Z00_002096 [Geotrichum candidum]
MIGKLLSGNPFNTSATINNNSISSNSPKPAFFPSNASIHSDASSVKSLDLPISVIDEADTRNLLYGSTTLAANCPLPAFDPINDIRILAITDIPHFDLTLFDSALYHHPQPKNFAFYSPEIPTFQSLQDHVFGSSQIKYTGPVTKLHPLPDSAQNKWLVSRLFRLDRRPQPNRRVNEVADYTCAVCVFISNAASLTDYWPELCAALLQLQRTVAHKLSSTLPSYYKEFSQRVRQPLGDDDIRHAIDVFRQRFSSALRIPRVVCGQKNWPKVFQELVGAWNVYDKKFLATALAAFIKNNSVLLASASAPSPVRTIVIGDRMATRKFIYILSSMIYDRNSTDFLQYLVDNRFDEESIHSTKSTAYCHTALPVPDAEGWQIPMTYEGQVAKSTSICTMSHVVKPSFSVSSSSLSSCSSSSSAVSLAAASRLSMSPFSPSSSFQNMASSMFRKAANSFSPSSLSSSFSTSFWHSPLSRSNSIASVDDVLFHSPSVEDCDAFGDARRYRGFYHNTVGKGSNATISNNRSCSAESKQSSLSSLIFESPTFDSSDVVDVGELDDDEKPDWDQKPVLPRVAGDVLEFHPDFALQGLSPAAAATALDELRRILPTNDDRLVVIDLTQQRVRVLTREAALTPLKQDVMRIMYDLKAILEAADLAKLENFYEKRFFI